MQPAERLLSALARPPHLLGALAVVQWLVVGGIALSAQHNGWFWYQGGDETYYYSTSWLLGQGQLPPTPIGYGWSVLTLPASLIGGTNVLDALPLIVLGQYLLLLPVGLVAVWVIGDCCGGRPLAISAAALWATLPALSIPLFAERWHPIYVDTVLPQLLGLTNLADFPSTIAVLVSAAFLLKGIDRRSHALILLSALAAGFAIGIKPANLVFLAAPFLILAVARRPAQLGVFGAGLLPALITLAIWKERGLGRLPVLAQPEQVLAGGGALVAAVGDITLNRYVDVDWNHLWDNVLQLQEVFWGIRILEWCVIAGAFAVGRFSIPKATFLAAWLGSYLVFKGGGAAAVVQDGTFFRLVQPALPAFVILAAAAVLLVPSLARRVRRPVQSAPWSRRQKAAAAGAIAVLTVAPIVIVAVLPPLEERVAARYTHDDVFVPVDAFSVEATLARPRVSLRWNAPFDGPTRVFYRVLRSGLDKSADPLITVQKGVACPQPTGIPISCAISSEIVATTRATIYVDNPPPGRWTYRIALSANAHDSLNEGDVLLVSKGAVVRIP
jgi:hypothetical protein